MSQLIFSRVAILSYYGRCDPVLIFAGRKLLNNAALIASHADGLTSHAFFSIQRKMFSIGFASEDYGEHSILRLSLFDNHASTDMAQWI